MSDFNSYSYFGMNHFVWLTYQSIITHLMKYWCICNTEERDNTKWVKKLLPSSKSDIHKTLDWLNDAFGDTTMEMNHGMLPFLLLLGTQKENTLNSLFFPQKTLQLQYGHINHNQIKPHCTLKIANNLAGCPMNFKSSMRRWLTKTCH